MTDNKGTPGLSAITVVQRTGDEPLINNGQSVGVRLSSFWSWACSDLVGNALRGMLAEYIVATALGCVDDTGRHEWDAYDLRTPGGLLVEVKSSAYLQSWPQERLSKITFSIPETQGWEHATNTYSSVRKRQSDVYVFCVLAHQDKATVNPLDLGQWDFYVAATRRLDAVLGEQETITLGSLLRAVQPTTATFDTLSACVIAAATAQP